MPIERSFIEYHRSLAEEMKATKNRIRNLIGDKHWPSDGEHKEAILRKVLRGQLPEDLRVGKGFVCYPHSNKPTSLQVDVLVTSKARPVLFKDGELAIVTPDAVEAIIEVKTRLRTPCQLTEALRKLANDTEEIRRHQASCWAGLFVFEDSVLDYGQILTACQDAANGTVSRVVSCLAFGADKFVRFWDKGRDINSPVDGPVWHAYKMSDLAPAYFISNLVWDVADGMPREMQFAWFPIEGGKETTRRWYVPLKDGEPRQFER